MLSWPWHGMACLFIAVLVLLLVLLIWCCCWCCHSRCGSCHGMVFLRFGGGCGHSMVAATTGSMVAVAMTWLPQCGCGGCSHDMAVVVAAVAWLWWLQLHCSGCGHGMAVVFAAMVWWLWLQHGCGVCSHGVVAMTNVWCLQPWHGGYGQCVVFVTSVHGGYGHCVVFVAMVWWPWPWCGVCSQCAW